MLKNIHIRIKYYNFIMKLKKSILGFSKKQIFSFKNYSQVLFTLLELKNYSHYYNSKTLLFFIYVKGILF